MLTSIPGNQGCSLPSNIELPSVRANSGAGISSKKQMDLNDDGEITYNEFEEYCNQNNIVEKDKNTLVKVMLNARLIQEIAQKREEIKQREELERKAELEELREENTDMANDIQNENTEAQTINPVVYKNAHKAYSLVL